eukprot:14526926-Alexandrium_andersonii.AAC.1
MPVVGAQATDGMFVANLYAKHGTDVESLFTFAFDTAARVGQSPYVICGDFNCSLEGSRALTAALNTGEWFSAAVCAGSSRPTYSASREWNGVDHDDGATCIDHVLLNRAALHLFSGIEFIRNPDVPGHTALQ